MNKDDFNPARPTYLHTVQTVYVPSEIQPILRLSRTGVAALLHSGQLRAIRVGRKWLIPASALNEFLERKTS
jgi:excisionase family DNA binding protein